MTLRIAIVDGMLPERLQLAILVAKHVWGDPKFAKAAADAHAAAERARQLKASARAGEVGDTGDCANGFGRRRFKDGNVYEGRWKDGVPHGSGTMQYAVGAGYTRYVGGWNAGVQCGRGRMVYEKGTMMILGLELGLERYGGMILGLGLG